MRFNDEWLYNPVVGTIQRKTAEQLAEEHWEWVGDLLGAVGADSIKTPLHEYLYKTAFVHGFKHGSEGR